MSANRYVAVTVERMDRLFQTVFGDANEGESTCPICGKEWLVTPMEDCMLPSCGCFGSDTSRTNLGRPCEPCGILHFYTCERVSEP